MDEIELYHYSLQQEVLKETAADEFSKLVNFMCINNLSEYDNTPYAKLFWELSEFKNSIISDTNNDDKTIQNITKQIEVFRKRIKEFTE